jgi:IS5 family transposase
MLARCQKVLTQGKQDKKNISSLHKPDVVCYAKGKARVRCEFGSKVALLVGKTRGIITGVVNFSTSIYDGKTLAPVLAHAEAITGQRAKRVIVDEGYRGATHCGTTEIIRPHQLKVKPDLARAKGYFRRRVKGWFNRRAAIEPRIGHLKSDFRLNQNFLKGIEPDAVNALMAAAASNVRVFIRPMLLWLSLRIAFLTLFQGRVFYHEPTYGVDASSHREAPLISNDPLADNTDLYAFRLLDRPNTVRTYEKEVFLGQGVETPCYVSLYVTMGFSPLPYFFS